MNMTRVVDPTRAKAFFQDKVDFSTGPVEVDHMIKSHENHISLIDVREAEDFAKGHIPGATNLPQGTWEQANGLSKDKTNIVYCYAQTCHLAANACLKFAAQGFPVMEMEGGFEAWKDAELDIEQEPANRLKKPATAA